ncbi:serine hydrolase [Bradyrhizobium sp. LjRoot220]|uniref:hypothetical protein n=1 Tax=Bradyrhizobium sp. LjRoot220 TaxID=3342284 RepID=UPI003ED151D7
MGSARPFMAAIGISLFIAAGFPARQTTLRDLLTMSSGFAPHEMVAVPGVWNSSVWMIRRTVKHTPGTHFYYDDQGTDLIAIILRRAVAGAAGGIGGLRPRLHAQAQRRW